jgi:hypothetical protein
MLREIEAVMQDDPNLRRRWFQGDYFDLFTWQDTKGNFTCFQLCYDIERNERALVWSWDQGFYHDGVEHEDRGLSRPASALLIEDGKLDSGTVVPRFTSESAQIAPEVRELVLSKIREYLIERHRARTRRRQFRRERWQQRHPTRETPPGN